MEGKKELNRMSKDHNEHDAHSSKESRSYNKITNQLVVQSNELVEAHYDAYLSKNEQRLIKYASSKIKPTGEGFPHCTIEVKELMQAAGVKGNNYHQIFEDIADELTKRRIKIKSKEKTGWFPWFQAIIYEKGLVHISFNPLLENMLLNIEGGYTKYEWNFIQPLNKSHSIRLFEILKQYAPIGKRTIEIEELKKMLGIADKYKDGFGNFKRRVLEPAKKELNEETQLKFDYKPIKKGKSFKYIEFTIKSYYKDEQLDLFSLPPAEGGSGIEGMVEDEGNEYEKKVVALLKTIGVFINPETIRQMQWEEYGLDLFKEVYEEIKLRNGIKNYPKYITSILKAKKNSKDSDEEGRQNNKVKTAVIDFINRNKDSVEPSPDFVIQDNAVSYFVKKLSVSEEEANHIWSDNREFILAEKKKIRTKAMLKKMRKS